MNHRTIDIINASSLPQVSKNRLVQHFANASKPTLTSVQEAIDRERDYLVFVHNNVTSISIKHTAAPNISAVDVAIDISGSPADIVAAATRANGRSLLSIQRRLDAAALDQLRVLATQQLATIEQQQARIARLEASERDAWLIADNWREDALDYLTQLAEETGQRVGLTPCGQVFAIPDQQVDV